MRKGEQKKTSRSLLQFRQFHQFGNFVNVLKFTGFFFHKTLRYGMFSFLYKIVLFLHGSFPGWTHQKEVQTDEITPSSHFL
jgi:hypothetical protein